MNTATDTSPAPTTKRPRGRRAMPRADYDRFQLLATMCGESKMTPEEIAELRLLALRVGGRRAVRALGLR